MGFRIEDNCVGPCPMGCIHCGRSHEHVYYCDRCDAENEPLYEADNGDEVCWDCYKAQYIEKICDEVSKMGKGVVVPANYNCPGQLVISGDFDAINEACEQLKAAGAKRALPLKVGGAFHSPLMQPAKDELQAAIEQTEIKTPKCPVYQNVDAKPHTDPAEIKANLIAQLTSSVRWAQSVENMIADGADDFTECGPGKALQGMIAKINKEVSAHGIDE